MSEDSYLKTKEAVLKHIQQLFEEMEEEMVLSHQEKYTLLEDMFENATDEDELRVAFDRWYADHSDELKLDYEAEELWDQALGGDLDYDSYTKDDEGGDGYVEPSNKKE